jgi:hypothetical protein
VNYFSGVNLIIDGAEPNSRPVSSTRTKERNRCKVYLPRPRVHKSLAKQLSVIGWQLVLVGPQCETRFMSKFCQLNIDVDLRILEHFEPLY